MDIYCIVGICYYPCCYCAIWDQGMKYQSSILNSVAENEVSIPVQGDGRHLDYALIVIKLEELTSISCLTGISSWSQTRLVGTFIACVTCNMTWKVTLNSSHSQKECSSLSYAKLFCRFNFGVVLCLGCCLVTGLGE